jgi:AraC-like DNA-binding protein
MYPTSQRIVLMVAESSLRERWHFHPQYELTLITKGNGKRLVGNHVANFSSPDMVLIGPNIPHCWSNLRNSSGYSLQFTLDGNLPLGQLDEMRALEETLQQAHFGIRFTGPVVDRVKTALKAIVGQSMLARLAKFIEVMGEIATAPIVDRHLLCDTSLTHNQHDHHMAAISRAVGYVLANLEEEIRLEDLLKVTSMSKPTFCRQFKSHTGRSLTTFINEVRIANARRLLTETEQSITQIAYESGFQNLSHFNVQFRKTSNESPSEFRRGVKKQT